MGFTAKHCRLLAVLLLLAALGAPILAEVQIPSQFDWTLAGTALTAGPAGAWDARLYGQISPSTVIKKDGVYYLYYVGADGDRSTDGGPRHRSLGLATSNDGINFTKQLGNPVIGHLPHNNQEEGVFSAGATLDADGAIVMHYGAIWAPNATTEFVNSYLAVAESQDGLNFTGHQYVLNWNDSAVWGYGDELFGVGTFNANDLWHSYYIAKGNVGAWKLGLASGPAPDNLSATTSVITSGGLVWGGGDPMFLSENKIVLFLVRQNQGVFSLEARTALVTDPAQLSAAVQTYDLSPYVHTTVYLDVETATWFMYQATDRAQDGNHIIVRTAPARGVPGDLDLDADVDQADIDTLRGAINAGNVDPKFELNGDTQLDGADLNYLIHTIIGTERGDANLDFNVDEVDLSAVRSNFGLSSGWAGGNFDLNTIVDAADLALLRAHSDFSAASQAAPEPSTLSLITMLGFLLPRHRKS